MTEEGNWDMQHISTNEEKTQGEGFWIKYIRSAFIQQVDIKFQVFGLSQWGSG